MINNENGKIINIASVVGQTGNIGQVNYGAAKGGVIAFTKSLARELARKGITVNAIAPGTIITEFNRKHFEEHPEDLAEIVKTIPKGRPGYPSDCVSAALFLASDESDFVTGQILFADGGTSIC